MNDLRDLYQEVILDHSRRPRHYGQVDHADRKVDGHNPLCGDRLTLFVRLAGNRIAEIGFLGAGCAISKASASMMTDAVQGLTLDEARALFDGFHAMVTASPDEPADPALLERLGKLVVFQGVAEYPTRVKCATLPWHTLQAALADARVVVSTESET